ncbi:NIPA-like protein 2 [Beauveria bassiana]|uniref:NIPA-like protein 2 n=1 Tax=Beauveria bassiana TaxID=176275 RepID=A0A2N6NDX3_BEABA|nr:NIPA-like protein 2 [Beauveria bassiana]
MQIRYVNKALQRFDSTQVIPIQFVMFTLCVIIGSAVLYRDFEKTTPDRAAKFVGGCLLTFFGVFLITSGRQRKNEDEDLLEDADGIDETIGLIDQEGNPAAPSEGDSRQNTPSRRSSKVSRVSFAEPAKITFQDYPPTPPAHREPQPTPSGAERPVTPRANTTTPKSTFRDRDRTFYSPSPLYSTVTTVVKDALRQNTKNQSSLRRIRSSIRASLFIDSDEEDQGANDHDTQQTIAVPPSENDLLRGLTAAEQENETTTAPGRQRARSLSVSVGNFFRTKRKTRSNDVESGRNGDSDGASDA